MQEQGEEENGRAIEREVTSWEGREVKGEGRDMEEGH